jgi:acyl-CoA reductase-like NAD-dependent aldehyde dehydrogenase
VATGYGNAGQVCISTQRVIALRKVYPDLLDALRPQVERIVAGDPLQEQTTMGPVIRERDAERIVQWIREAVAQGAHLVCGGWRQGTLVAPTVVADVQPTMRLARDELFGPAVGVMPASDLDEALALANHSRYGLSAGIFTRNLDAAVRFAREVDAGALQINWGPAWRADLMPYGGLKESGFGKEGPKYAIEEMTELKTVIIHGPA